MTEQSPGESTKIDSENQNLIGQLFGAEQRTQIIEHLATRTDYKASSIDNLMEVRAMPGIGEIIYFEQEAKNTSSDSMEPDISIQFRENGMIILRDFKSSIHTRYNPETREVVRYDRTQPGAPEQVLPRHAKNHFLKTVQKAQDFINTINSQTTPV